LIVLDNKTMANIPRTVEKPHARENMDKKMANRTRLSPRTIIEYGE
jgi:hypothetical protein